jgi:hypothetical protein
MKGINWSKISQILANPADISAGSLENIGEPSLQFSDRFLMIEKVFGSATRLGELQVDRSYCEAGWFSPQEKYAAGKTTLVGVD